MKKSLLICPRCLSPIENEINKEDISEGISAYEILMKNCHSLQKDLRVPHVLRAMAEYAALKLRQQRELQEPNIKLVNHPYNKNDEFQG